MEASGLWLANSDALQNLSSDCVQARRISKFEEDSKGDILCRKQKQLQTRRRDQDVPFPPRYAEPPQRHWMNRWDGFLLRALFWDGHWKRLQFLRLGNGYADPLLQLRWIQGGWAPSRDLRCRSSRIAVQSRTCRKQGDQVENLLTQDVRGGRSSS